MPRLAGRWCILPANIGSDRCLSADLNPLFSSVFGKRKKKSVDPSALVDSIGDARVGDVFTVSDYQIEIEDAYFIIEQFNRYESGPATWFELKGQDGDSAVWLNWSNGDGLHISLSTDRRAMGLKSLGIDENDLERLDREHSIDNYITHDGLAFYYQNSGEAFFYENNEGTGDGFYLWDFTSKDQSKLLSIDKWESIPFQAYISDVVSPESITAYKR